VPVAVKDVVEPTVRLDGEEGDNVMYDNSGVVVVDEPQAANPIVRDALNPITSSKPINRICLLFILFILIYPLFKPVFIIPY
jgi:hypothetical protein